MAKRVRGQRSTHRPGGIGPARVDREAGTARRIGSTARRSDEAAPVMASSAVSAKADVSTVTAPARTSTFSRAAIGSSTATTRDLRARMRLKSGGLQQRAAAEAGWVNEDLRRIAVISAIMVGGLALAWLLLVVVGLGELY